jgi:intron-binding protein aquarius
MQQVVTWVLRLQERFCKPNPGFLYNFQFIDVQPMLGPGESCPTPYFYQNIDEAEFAVRMFMYMRLIGYPAEKITILTSYNGQKALLDDVVQKHCARYPVFGTPKSIATVDKYQGQQNDYVLLSLVRTRRVGHLRDVRRLVVAMSRARLGLYVLGCRSLFEQCLELAPTFRKLLDRPSVLALVVRERWIEGVPIQREREGGSCDPATGGIFVQTLQQMEGVVQGIADRYHEEQRMRLGQAGQGMQQGQLAVSHTNGAAETVALAAPAQGADARQAADENAPESVIGNDNDDVPSGHVGASAAAVMQQGDEVRDETVLDASDT